MTPLLLDARILSGEVVEGWAETVTLLILLLNIRLILIQSEL